MKYLFFLLIFCIVINSYSQKSYDDIWKNYKTDFLKQNMVDKGYGRGFFAMHWQSEKERTFSSTEIVDYANKIGWMIKDTIDITPSFLSQWDDTFPFTFTDFNDSSMTYKFPRWIKSDMKLFRFDTGMNVVESLTNRETDINGYILLKSDGTEFSVYQMWGD